MELMSEFARKSVWFHQYEGMKEVAQRALLSSQTSLSPQSEIFELSALIYVVTCFDKEVVRS